MKRIDGTAIAQKVHEETRERVELLKGQGLRPGLAVVLVGDDSASRTYVRAKDKKAAELGLYSVKYNFLSTLTRPGFSRSSGTSTTTRSFTASWCSRRFRNT